MSDANNDYSDIINHQHHVSKKRPQMSRINRAAQFSPFAALTGYDDLITEASRLTNSQIELSDTQKEELDRKLAFLLRQGENCKAVFTYFLPDGKKLGGEYVSETGSITDYDELGHFITLDSGKTILIDSISEIECDELDKEDYTDG